MAQTTRVDLSLILFVVTFFLLPLLSQSQSDSEGFPTFEGEGFPTLDDSFDFEVALGRLQLEDRRIGERGSDFSLTEVLGCLRKPPILCSPPEKWKNELRLRTGYESLGHRCSSDPELNRLLLTPPPHDNENDTEYINWQRRILAPNQSLCNPLKHLQCSKTSGKCECREGLVWVEGGFKAGDYQRLTFARRERQNICVIPIESPCGVLEGRNITAYFNIFDRSKGPLVNGGPHCGPGVCLRRSYTQRQQVCTPRDGGDSELDLDHYFDQLPKLGLGEKCNVEHHNRLNVFSANEQSPSGFLAKRRKNLEDLKNSRPTGFCDLSRFFTCGNSGKCECMSPAQNESGSCVMYAPCVVTNELSQIFGNNTWSLSTRKSLMAGMSLALKGCPDDNFATRLCRITQDINHKMFMYCTCFYGLAGFRCRDTLTRFLMFVRVPSYPIDVEGVLDKRDIFDDLNHKAIEFEQVFKLGSGVSCNITAESEAAMIVEKIQELEKEGTLKTKADYVKLTHAIDQQIKNSKGLCLRFDAQPLMCNMTTAKCEKDDIKNIMERCNHVADNMCEGREIQVQDGKCVCDKTPGASPSPLSPNVKKTSGSPPEINSYFNVLFILLPVFVFN